MTYTSFVCKPYHVNYVAVEDKLDYLDDPVSPAASFIETKLLLNSTVYGKKGSTIHIMQPHGFLIGLADGSTRLYVNKFEALLPSIYTKIQSKLKNSHKWVCLHQNKK